MDAAQITEADGAFKRLHRLFVAFFAFEVVSGGKRVAGVDADADARSVADHFHDARELFERIPEIASLSCGVFQHCRDALRFIQRRIDRFRDQTETLFFRDFAQMAAGMEVQAVQAEQHASRHFIRESLPRLFAFYGVGISEIDQIAVMRQNVFRCVSVFPAVRLECLNGCFRQRRTRPLPLVFCEHGERFRPDRGGVQRGVFDTSGNGDMGTDVFHWQILPFFRIPRL